MGYVLRLLLPAAASLLLAAGPAAAAAPRAQTAAQRHAEVLLEDAGDLLEGRGVRTGREVTDALRELAVNVRNLRGEERDRALALLARPDDGNPDSPPEDQFEPGLPVSRDCSKNFCVHHVTVGEDAATADQAKTVLDEAESVRAFENGTLAWREPPSDGTLGGQADRVDIYLKELGGESLFGWAATDPGQETQAQHSYLVLDDDFDPSQFGGVPALDSLRVTLAHEYGHVLQYGYDVLADGWHYESSAVWLEQRMYPSLNDWLRFVYDGSAGPGWRSLTEVPLTSFDDARDEARNAKPYGDVVFNHFLTSRYGATGDALQRRTWELSDGFSRASTGAYDRAIKEAGGAGLATDFGAFAAAAAEWQVPAAGFPLAGALPDVERVGTLATDGSPVAPVMDHTTFAFYDVPDTSAERIRLVASFPAGTRGALALVARAGASGDGEVTTRLTELPAGGIGGVTLDQPHSYIESGGRITAVLVNSDATHAAEYDVQRGDWQWSRDRQAVGAALTSDLTPPAVTERSPGPGASRVGTRKAVRVTFSKEVSGVDGESFSLRDPRGRKVPATVAYAAASRTALLTPTTALADSTRYTVRLTGAIADVSATSLPATRWSFTTVKRRPRARLSILSKGPRAVLFLLRSSDRDRVRFGAKLVAGGRAIARSSGSVRPGATRFVKIPARGRSRARLVVTLRDPQGNRRRLARDLRLRR